MSKLTWDRNSERFYESGIDMGVVYPFVKGKYQTGEAWNGLISVTEQSSGGEPSSLYADNEKYVTMLSPEELELQIEAYSYPNGFKQCIGRKGLADGIDMTRQSRSHFGLTYRTLLGNDTEGLDFGYKLHLIFSGLAQNSDAEHNTINDDPDISSYSWTISTDPVEIEGQKPTPSMVFDSRRFKDAGISNVLSRIEDILYGTDSTKPRMPTVNDILDAFPLEMYLRDNSGDYLLDSNGTRMQSFVA